MDEERPDAFLGIDPDAGERDLFRLVLTVIDLSRQLMEKQVSRDESAELSEEQRGALALALLRLEEAMEGFRLHYGLALSDLDLGPGALSAEIAERGSYKHRR